MTSKIYETREKRAEKKGSWWSCCITKTIQSKIFEKKYK